MLQMGSLDNQNLTSRYVKKWPGQRRDACLFVCFLPIILCFDDTFLVKNINISAGAHVLKTRPTAPLCGQNLVLQPEIPELTYPLI